MKKRGAVVTSFVIALAAIGLVTIFIKNASPYVTIAQARTMAGGGSLHIAGQIVKGTETTDHIHKQLKFQMKDDKGDLVQVVYTGPPPANMSTATQVVVKGGMEKDEFHAKEMLVKCPSKYESSDAGSVKTGS